jgi:hypothetical protein
VVWQGSAGDRCPYADQRALCPSKKAIYFVHAAHRFQSSSQRSGLIDIARAPSVFLARWPSSPRIAKERWTRPARASLRTRSVFAFKSSHPIEEARWSIHILAPAVACAGDGLYILHLQVTVLEQHIAIREMHTVASNAVVVEPMRHHEFLFYLIEQSEQRGRFIDWCDEW